MGVALVVRSHGSAVADLVDKSEIRGRLGAERALTLVESVLDERGYEPYRPAPDRLRLRNWPVPPIRRARS